MNVLLDSSAMIALLSNEAGAEYVATYIDAGHSIFAHALNLCEVFYHFYRVKGETTADEAIIDLLALRVMERNDLQAEFGRLMGHLRRVKNAFR